MHLFCPISLGLYTNCTESSIVYRWLRTHRNRCQVYTLLVDRTAASIAGSWPTSVPPVLLLLLRLPVYRERHRHGLSIAILLCRWPQPSCVGRAKRSVVVRSVWTVLFPLRWNFRLYRTAHSTQNMSTTLNIHETQKSVPTYLHYVSLVHNKMFYRRLARVNSS